MVVGIIMAIIIKALIPDKLNNDDRKTAAVMWCALTSAVLALGGASQFFMGWIVTCVGMLPVAWPRNKHSNKHGHKNRPRCEYDRHVDRIIITDAEVIDVEAKVVDT